MDFYGIDFEGEYSLLGDEFPEIPALYIIYTEKACLYMGSTDNLKQAIEENEHAQQWIKLAEGKDIFIAFHAESDPESRQDIEGYLREKMKI